MTITARPLSYQDGGVALSGVLTLDESVPEKRPGILLIHGGAGLDEHVAAGASPGVAYDARADRRSCAAARTFLAEALSPES